MDMPVFYGTPSLLDRLLEEDDLNFNKFDPHYFPPLQIFEDENMLYIRACIPGVSLEDVSLTLKGGVLLIEGNVPSPDGRCIRRERACGPFVREVQLPCDVDADAVEAVMRDGLLTVHLPKAVKKDDKRIIPVESAKEAKHG